MENEVLEMVTEEVIEKTPKTKIGMIAVGVVAGAAITYMAVKKIKKTKKKVKLEVIKSDDSEESEK